MDSAAVHKLGVVQDGPFCAKIDALQQQLEILTSSMEGHIRTSVTPTENARSEVSNVYWVGIDRKVESATDQSLFTIDDGNCSPQDTSENELLHSPGSEEYLSSASGTVQERNVEREESLVNDAPDGDKMANAHQKDASTQTQGEVSCLLNESKKSVGRKPTSGLYQGVQNLSGTHPESEKSAVEDPSANFPNNLCADSEETVDEIALHVISGSPQDIRNLSGTNPESEYLAKHTRGLCAESEKAMDKNAADVTSGSSQGVEKLFETDPESKKPALEDLSNIPNHLCTDDDKVKQMEEGCLRRGDVSVRSHNDSCELLIPVEVEERRMDTKLRPAPGGNDSLWRDMTHALQMVDVTLQRACLQSAFNVVMAFLQEKSPPQVESPTVTTLPHSGNTPPEPTRQVTSPEPTMSILSNDLTPQAVPVAVELQESSIKDSDPKPRALFPFWSAEPRTQTPDARRHQQPTVRPATPVVQVPNYFRCTESFRRKLATPPITTSFRKAANLPPLRQTPKKDSKSKPRTISDRCDLVVEAKAIPRSIRGGGRVITRPEVKSVERNRATSSPLVVSGVNLAPKPGSAARRAIVGGYAMARRHSSKKRENKAPRLNPY